MTKGSDHHDTRPLYRVAATRTTSQDQFGKVSLHQPPGFLVLALFSLGVILALVLFLYFGEYARKETVSGYLTPQSGTVDVFAERPGVIRTVHVLSGMRVLAGNPLVTIDLSLMSPDGGDPQGTILQEFANQRLLLQSRINRLNNRHLEEEKVLRKLVESTRSKLVAAREILTLSQAQLGYASQRTQAIRRLYDTGSVSRLDWLNLKAANLEETRRTKIARQDCIRLEAELATNLHALSVLPSQGDTDLDDLLDRLSILRQRELQAEQLKNYQITAAIDGKVTALQITAGQLARPGTPLMTLVPDNSNLQGQLLIPGRAIGLIKTGFDVNLLYDAFPHQHFGVYLGTLIDLSTASIRAGEVRGPITTHQPVYLAKVSLNNQVVIAYGKQFPLQPGMTFKADIRLESRRLYEWLLAPFYALKGRT